MQARNVMKSIVAGSVVCVGMGICLHAQEPGEKAVPPPAPAATSENATTIKNDAGTMVVYQTQESPLRPNAETAEMQIDNFLSKRGWTEGRNNTKDGHWFFISKQKRPFECDDPAIDDSFIVSREVAIKMAILKAKADTIQFVNTELSASEQYDLPGSDTDVKKLFAPEMLELTRKFKLQKVKAEQLLGDTQEATEAARKGSSMTDKLKYFIDAVIKKLDKSYDPAKISAEQHAKAKQLKEEYEATTAELDKIDQQIAEARAKQKTSLKSEVATYAAMPIMGTTVLAQAESWNPTTKRYEVCVVFVWSQGLEESARALLTGENVPVIPPAGKGLTLAEWLGKQDLSVMMGPRQFLDEKGNRVFLGIAARPVGTSGDDEEMAAGLSNSFAQQFLAFSLMADARAYTKAVQIAATIRVGEKSEIKTAESFEQHLSQEIKGMQIRGMARVKAVTLEHPISKIKIRVSVYAVSPDDAKFALARERDSFASAIEVGRKQAEAKGKTQGMRDAREASKNDVVSFEKGRAEGRNDVERTIAEREAAKAQAAAKQPPTAQPQLPPPLPAAPKTKGTASGGVYMGDGDVNGNL